jgi:thioredoxin-related protein
MRCLALFCGIVVAGLAGVPVLAFAQTAPQPAPATAIRWYTDLDEAQRAAQASNKLLLVDVYTRWCAYCNLMGQRIYQKPEFIQYIDQKFIAVHLDAETADTLDFQGRRFPYHPQHRVNELAYLLLDGRIEYPATVFLTPQGELIQTVHGYLEAPIMDRILRYFAEGYYKTNKWDIYMNRY